MQRDFGGCSKKHQNGLRNLLEKNRYSLGFQENKEKTQLRVIFIK
jgi:hypothetical protein